MDARFRGDQACPEGLDDAVDEIADMGAKTHVLLEDGLRELLHQRVAMAEVSSEGGEIPAVNEGFHVAEIVEPVVVVEAVAVQKDPAGAVSVVGEGMPRNFGGGVAEFHDVSEVEVDVAHPARLGDHVELAEGREH